MATPSVGNTNEKIMLAAKSHPNASAASGIICLS